MADLPNLPAVHLLLDPQVPPGTAFDEAEVSPLTVRLIVHLFFPVNLGFYFQLWNCLMMSRSAINVYMSAFLPSLSEPPMFQSRLYAAENTATERGAAIRRLQEIILRLRMLLAPGVAPPELDESVHWALLTLK